MKRRGMWLAALALCVAMGVTSLASAERIRVKSKIQVTFVQGSAYAPYTQDTFLGDVKARKKCARNRTVKIVGTSFRDKTDRNGEFEIGVGNAAPATYTVKAKRKRKRLANGDVKICRPAKALVAVTS